MKHNINDQDDLRFCNSNLLIDWTEYQFNIDKLIMLMNRDKSNIGDYRSMLKSGNAFYSFEC